MIVSRANFDDDFGNKRGLVYREFSDISLGASILIYKLSGEIVQGAVTALDADSVTVKYGYIYGSETVKRENIAYAIIKEGEKSPEYIRNPLRGVMHDNYDIKVLSGVAVLLAVVYNLAKRK